MRTSGGSQAGEVVLPPGIVVLERGWLSSNNVVLLGADRADLVDSGYGAHAAQTLALVERAREGRPLVSLLNTHLHSDHCGGNAALQEQFPAMRTFIPPGLADAVERWDLVALTYEPTGQVCPRFRFDGVLSPGRAIRLGDREWEVHAAPGHDQHSVVLFEPVTRTLLSADALWENGFGVVFQELEGEDAFEEVAQTLDVIEALAPALVIPGHGAVFTAVPKALERARSRLAAYRADPRRHAAHGAKVLLKFKLLEFQCIDQEQFLTWAESTPYLRLVWERFFSGLELRPWLLSLVTDLINVGAARRNGGHVENV